VKRIGVAVVFRPDRLLAGREAERVGEEIGTTPHHRPALHPRPAPVAGIAYNPKNSRPSARAA